MTVGLIHFDSNIGRVLILLNTNGVSVTDSEKEHKEGWTFKLDLQNIFHSLTSPESIRCEMLN